jgi:hypothetical protein
MSDIQSEQKPNNESTEKVSHISVNEELTANITDSHSKDELEVEELIQKENEPVTNLNISSHSELEEKVQVATEIVVDLKSLELNDLVESSDKVTLEPEMEKPEPETEEVTDSGNSNDLEQKIMNQEIEAESMVITQSTEKTEIPVDEPIQEVNEQAKNSNISSHSESEETAQVATEEDLENQIVVDPKNLELNDLVESLDKVTLDERKKESETLVTNEDSNVNLADESQEKPEPEMEEVTESGNEFEKKIKVEEAEAEAKSMVNSQPADIPIVVDLALNKASELTVDELIQEVNEKVTNSNNSSHSELKEKVQVATEVDLEKQLKGKELSDEVQQYTLDDTESKKEPQTLESSENPVISLTDKSQEKPEPETEEVTESGTSNDLEQKIKNEETEAECMVNSQSADNPIVIDLASNKASEILVTETSEDKDVHLDLPVEKEPVKTQATEKNIITSEITDESSTTSKLSTEVSKKTPQTYLVKWVVFDKTSLPIILQNENGPCPLISICNVLLLRKQMVLSANIKQITCNNLIETLADTLFNVFVPKWSKSRENLANQSEANVIRHKDDQARLVELQLNLEKNIEGCLEIFEKLKFGLDVNVKFSSCRDFEYTRELDIFDIFNISLYHGWLIDPQEVMLYKQFSNKSYNQIVELTFCKDAKNVKSDNEEDASLIGILAENFLESTASQLTYFGLSELHANIAKGDLSVLFRNNHFSIMYKNPVDQKLYLLVTDQGYLTHESIVWESFDNIEGDAVFCDSNFKRVIVERNFEKVEKNEIPNDKVLVDEKSDYMLALSLQEIDDKEAAVLRQKQEKPTPANNVPSTDAQTSRPTAAEPVTTDDANKSKKEKSTCSLM